MVKQRIKTMSTGVSYVISNRHKFGYLISTNITMKQGRTYLVGRLGRPPSYRLANFRACAEAAVWRGLATAVPKPLYKRLGYYCVYTYLREIQYMAGLVSGGWSSSSSDGHGPTAKAHTSKLICLVRFSGRSAVQSLTVRLTGRAAYDGCCLSLSTILQQINIKNGTTNESISFVIFI
jgi:hypothetical protein